MPMLYHAHPWVSGGVLPQSRLPLSGPRISTSAKTTARTIGTCSRPSSSLVYDRPFRPCFLFRPQIRRRQRPRDPAKRPILGTTPQTPQAKG